jgi:Flp pilus assembly protein TadG
MIRGRARSFSRAEGGATAVEFAIVVGPLLLLMFGTLEFGRLLWTREALQSAAIAGARCMGILQTSCTTSGAYSSSKSADYVIAEASALKVKITSTNVTTTNTATCAGVSGFSQVTISYTFQTALPYFLKALTGGVPLSATACFPNQA